MHNVLLHEGCHTVQPVIGHLPVILAEHVDLLGGDTGIFQLLLDHFQFVQTIADVVVPLH